jgi:hypothetical protein
LTAILLTVGLCVPCFGLLYEMPSPLPQPVRELDRDDTALRSLVLEGGTAEDDAELLLARYAKTRDDLGGWVTIQEAGDNWLRRWNTAVSEAWSESRYLVCELCQLPGVGLWTLSGIPVLLDDASAGSTADPTLVVEIPRRGTECRIYDPPDPAFTIRPLAELPSCGEGHAAIVLKLDVGIPMVQVSELLAALRDHGVARVSVAIRAGREERYGDFVAIFEEVVTGEAKRIHIVLEQTAR